MQMILVLLKNSTDPLEFLNKLLRNYHVIGNFFFLKFAFSAKVYGAAMSQAINKQMPAT